MRPSSFAAPYIVAASAFAAAALVSAAAADVTYTLTNASFTGFNFVQAYGPGWHSGTLTGVRINVTLTASTSYTYADDLCVYIDAAPFSLGGLLQCGGFSNLSATQRYRWPNGNDSAPGTTSVGTVNFTTGINMSTNPTQSIWIGNGYSAAGTSGTWIGTITLIGLGWEGGWCTFDTDLDGRADCNDNCPTVANPSQTDCNNNSIGDACESFIDCNTNGMPDSCDVASGAPDFNIDTVPDTCQCLADLFVDHQVNGADLGALLAFWGPVNPGFPQADMNRDNVVNGADLGYLLNAWGLCTN